MSKNIFSVLAHDESDDDKPKQTNQAPRLPKKEARAQDKQLREKFGDQVQKDTATHKRSDNAPKNKGDYASGEKRPFERRSGTGKPAHTNDFKKGGHGKGNVGTKDGKDIAQNEIPVTEEVKEEVKVTEEPEIIISAEEYISKSGLNYNFLNHKEDIKNANAPTITDPNLKVISQKSKDEVVFRKAKNPDTLMQGSKNISANQEPQRNAGKRRDSPKKKTNVVYNETNFPTLG
jgi:hypothetical protein